MILSLILSLAAVAAHADGPDPQTPREIAAARAVIERDFANAVEPWELTELDKAALLVPLRNIDPGHEVPPDLLENALLFFQANKSRFPNQNYITIVDFKPRSDHYRFFLINMQDGSVEKYHTTHGEGSDPKETGYAQTFGNVINSGMSSLGYIRTAEVYSGTYKTAVRLDGLSSTNSNLRARAVIFHGWNGVHEANVIQGLTAGCITLDWKVKDSVLDKIKEGSLMYVGVSN